MPGLNALILFVRKPVLGKVKTRLAATVGDAQALAIYQTLLEHTLQITLPISADKLVFYADEIPTADLWSAAGYIRYAQVGHDLGARMHHAISTAFIAGYKNVAVIGSDCATLTSNIVDAAFKALITNDVVIGPADDGGYYLIGMQQPQATLFTQMHWSTQTVLSDTLSRIDEQVLNCYLMPTLSDVDNEADWLAVRHLFTATNDQLSKDL